MLQQLKSSAHSLASGSTTATESTRQGSLTYGSGANRTQDVRVYSHDGPIGHARAAGSGANTSRNRRVLLYRAAS
eukprot:1586574-Pyramimonas_sp.AAC.1